MPSSRTVAGHDAGLRHATWAARKAVVVAVARLRLASPSWQAAAHTVPAVAVRIKVSPAATWRADWLTRRREVRRSIEARAQFESAASKEPSGLTAPTSS